MIMHPNAMKQGKLFFDTYCVSDDLVVGEIGSYDVNGSLRSLIGDRCKQYIGFDFSQGPGVDIVLDDPYILPVADNTFDVLVTTSCFEHSEMFWLTFLEGLRVLKPSGIFYINVPSSWMGYHRFPVDCWRFYPDSAKALETWANRNDIPAMVLESYVATPTVAFECADMVSVFLNDKQYLNAYPRRILDGTTPYQDFFNAFRFPTNQQFVHDWSQPNFPHQQSVEYPLS